MQPKKFTNKFLLRAIIFLVAILIVWRLVLSFVLDFTLSRYEVTPSFPYYNELLSRLSPRDAVWAHFDGIHYLRVARYSYADTGTQAFFPLYPLVVRGISFLGFEIESSAVFLNGFFLLFGSLALVLLFNSIWPVVFLLTFPTSFFFATIYTESMFFALSMIFFLSLKNKHYFLSAIIAGLASATRLVGLFLAISLIVAYYQNEKDQLYQQKHKNMIWIAKILPLFLISISGFLFYAYYLYQKWQDPLMFFHVQKMFGAERSSGELILLPQVLFRYAKMIFTVDPRSLLYQRIWFELLTFLAACFLWVKSFKKVPLSWSVYSGFSLLLPTFTGTLSSMPRYILILVPFLVPIVKSRQLFWAIPLGSLLLYCFALFARGLFVA